MALLADWLADGTRLLTITGPPGVGKTRLAHELVQRAAAARSIVWFCDVTLCHTVEDLVRAVEAALDLSAAEEADLGHRQNKIGRALYHAGSALLILDNFEQLQPEAVAVLAGWVGQLGESALLVTSRQRTALPAERVLGLGPLALPEHEEMDAEALYEAPAVQLFLGRCQWGLPGLTFGDADLAEVGRLVRLLDGLPLAIELCAARLPLLTLRQMGQRLSSRFEVLRQSNPGGPGHHESLEGAIAWSWDLLRPEERTALQQCAVFVGSFDLEAFEAVVHPLEGERSTALDTLQVLVDHSLVVCEYTAEARRFRLLVSVREFVLRQTDSRGVFGQALVRHARYHSEWAVATGRRLRQEQSATLLERLEGSLPELSAIVERQRAGLIQEPQAAVSAVLVLEGLLSRLGGFQRLAELFGAFEGIPVAQMLPAHLAVRYLLAQSRPLLALLRLDEAQHCIEEARGRAEENGGDADLLAQVHMAMSQQAWGADDYPRALAAAKAYLQKFPQHTTSAWRARLVANNASTLSSFGRPETALARYAEARAVLQSSKAPQPMGHLNEAASITYLFVGRIHEARACARAGLEAAAQSHDRAALGWRTALLGVVEMSLRNHAAAHALLHEGKRLLAAHGRLWHLEQVQHWTGTVAILSGQYEAAHVAFEEGEAMMRRSGSQKHRAILYQDRAFLAWAERRPDDFEALGQQALGYLGDTRDPIGRAPILGLLCLHQAMYGDVKRAEALLAAARAELAGCEPSVFWRLLDLAEVAVALGRVDRGTRGVDRADAYARLRSDMADWHRPIQLSGETQPAVPWRDRFPWIGLVLDLLERELPWSEQRQLIAQNVDPTAQGLLVDPVGQAFRPPGHDWIDLTHRPKLLDALWPLVAARQNAEVVPLTVHQLFTEIWPGEQALPTAERSRVYVAINTLRKLGLEQALQRTPEGYRIDPTIPTFRIEPPARVRTS